MKKVFVSTGLAVCLIATASAASARDCGRVTIASMNWQSAEVLSNIDKLILEAGYGCEAEITFGDTVPTITSMVEKGKPDIAPEAWIDLLPDVVRKGLDSKQLVATPKVLSQGGVSGWWIPKYLADAHPDIKTIGDVLKHPELFPSPEDPSKGAIYNGAQGWGYRHSAGPDEGAVLAATVAALKSKVQEIGQGKVAAFICEPIIGSGGVIVPPAGYLKAMRATCDELGILLIVDEVITGFGRTGPMFGCEHEGVSPDIMTMAKGLTSGYAPMGATIISEQIYAALAEAGSDGTPFGHGQTYAGHPVSAAIANATLDLYENGLLKNGTEVGEYFQTKLRALEQLDVVGQVRGRGMLAGVELVADKHSRAKPDAKLKLGQKILSHAFSEGLVFRAFADDILGFAPSLNYTHADVDKLVEILTFSIEKVTGAKWV